MIVYKDQMFCADECYNVSCFRHVINTAGNVENWPVSYGSFKEGCYKYMPPPMGWWEELTKALHEGKEQ